MTIVETTELTEQEQKELEEEIVFLKQQIREIEKKLGY